SIRKETTTLKDAYGGNLQFRWEVIQVPVPAGLPLGVVSTGPSVVVSATPKDAGTWRFRLTVTDQTNQTAEETTNVLVDSDPTASIVGPDQPGNLALPLDLDGGGSTDPDASVTYLHTDPVVDLAPGIVRYNWNVLQVPDELYGTHYPGPVADVFNVDGSS